VCVCVSLCGRSEKIKLYLKREEFTAVCVTGNGMEVKGWVLVSHSPPKP